MALLVSNEADLWMPPEQGNTRDRAFRLHEGRTLAGQLLWSGGDYTDNTRTLRGTYPLNWQPYSQYPGPRGEFRYLAVFTERVSPGPAARHEAG
ncbi:hypothetical protein [Streptomyces sp. NPDC021020]|uniref:hypothetical protein n=1 Tax=Streptomyces sp. NPDC021020 TaxID=3365109 RepID=UPI0037B3DCDD